MAPLFSFQSDLWAWCKRARAFSGFVAVVFSLISFTAFARVPNILRHAVGDVKNTFAAWPVLVLLGGSELAATTLSYDDDVNGHFSRSKNLGGFDKVAAFIGQPYVLDPAALAVFGAGEIFHNEKLSAAGETLFESLIFTDVMTGGLKLAFRRARPNGGNYGFPSGHAAGSFAIATVLETLYGPKFGLPAYALAGLLSYTRIDSNAHNLSDVVFGAALGSAIGWGTARFHKKEFPRFFVTPVVSNAQGVAFTYLF